MFKFFSFVLMVVITVFVVGDAVGARRQSVGYLQTTDVIQDKQVLSNIVNACRQKVRTSYRRKSSSRAKMVSLCPVKEYKVESSMPQAVTPFRALINHLQKIFKVVRYFVYIAAVLALFFFGAKAMWEDKVEWKKLGWMAVAVLIVMFAGVIIDFVAQTSTGLSDEKYEASREKYYIYCRDIKQVYKRCDPNVAGAKYVLASHVVEIDNSQAGSGSDEDSINMF